MLTTDLRNAIDNYYVANGYSWATCDWEHLEYLNNVHTDAGYSHDGMSQFKSLLEYLGIDCSVWARAYKRYKEEWQQLPRPIHLRLGATSKESHIDTALWMICLPHVSERNPNLIAYYQSTEKLNREVETPIKYGRFLTSIFQLTSDEAQEEVENFKASTGVLPLNFVENNDVESWRDIYRSPNIKSCMNNTEYDVTRLGSYQCYCSSAFGLPDNGLRLAYIGESPEHAVARAIVNERKKKYLTVYGDSALHKALECQGYTKDSYFLDGVSLYTWWDENSDETEGWVHPYVDGSADYGTLYHVQGVDGSYQPVLVLGTSGDWDLADVGAVCP